MSVTEEIVDLPDVSLFVRRSGDPELPVLLAIHGGPGWDHSYLLPALDDLADIRHVVLFDLRGCGRSSRNLPIDAYQPDLCADDAAQLIAWLGRDRVDLLGFSYGGQIAMGFAGRYPHLIDRLILASTSAYLNYEHYFDDNEEYQRRSPAVDKATEAVYADATLGCDQQWRGDAMCSAPMNLWNLDLLDDWKRVLEQVRFSGAWGPAFVAGMVRPARPADPEQALRDAGRPTLILHGERELGFPVEVAQQLHAAVSNSELALIDDAAHAAHFEKRAEWVARLRIFLTN